MEVYFDSATKHDLEVLLDEPVDEQGNSKMDGKRGACVVLALIEIREAIQEVEATLREIEGVSTLFGMTFDRLMAEALGSGANIARNFMESIREDAKREQKEQTLAEMSAEDQKKPVV